MISVMITKSISFLLQKESFFLLSARYSFLRETSKDAMMMQTSRSLLVNTYVQHGSGHPFRHFTTARPASNRSRCDTHRSELLKVSAEPADISIIQDVPEPEDARGAIAVRRRAGRTL